jgi:hypothetical protein
VVQLEAAEAETSWGAGFPIIYHLADVPEVRAGMSSGSGPEMTARINRRRHDLLADLAAVIR